MRRDFGHGFDDFIENKIRIVHLRYAVSGWLGRSFNLFKYWLLISLSTCLALIKSIQKYRMIIWRYGTYDWIINHLLFAPTFYLLIVLLYGMKDLTMITYVLLTFTYFIISAWHTGLMSYFCIVVKYIWISFIRKKFICIGLWSSWSLVARTFGCRNIFHVNRALWWTKRNCSGVSWGALGDDSG